MMRGSFFSLSDLWRASCRAERKRSEASGLTRARRLALLLLLSGLFLSATASDSLRTLHAGLCFKKMAGFYWLNGISADYSSSSLLNNRLHTGINVTSSLLGSSLASHAIPVHFFELYGQLHFRSAKPLRPVAGLNAGLASAKFRNSIYDNLPDKQMLLSPEFGLFYQMNKPFAISASFGYNLLTGSGTRGLGLVYPLFFQFRVLHRM